MNGIIDLQEHALPADCYVYKHSTTCSVSAHAARVIRAHHFDLPVYWINVIEQRPLSNWIAQEYKTRHESPQLLCLRNGKVDRSWSHFDISPGNLPQAAGA